MRDIALKHSYSHSSPSLIVLSIFLYQYPIQRAVLSILSIFGFHLSNKWTIWRQLLMVLQTPWIKELSGWTGNYQIIHLYFNIFLKYQTFIIKTNKKKWKEKERTWYPEPITSMHAKNATTVFPHPTSPLISNKLKGISANNEQ